MTTEKFDPSEHVYVPKHVLLSEEEVKVLLEKYNISKKQLPSIIVNDPALRKLNPKIGDVVKIIRKSPTAAQGVYYRVVVSVK
ncbi:DNA-directed RNA polymerase subunit H [Candidatus Woesearchaeota archaeon]|nr:DNA-directed RNA polymerase subunit H [Candidatus Woesearchaeota archaeon]